MKPLSPPCWGWKGEEKQAYQTCGHSLLLEALSCPDSVVQLSTLSCLQPLLLEAPQVMSLHVDTLITKFLNLSASPSMVR